MSVTVDCYGFPRTPGENFVRLEKNPYQCLDTTDGTKTFVRFSTKENGPIWCINNSDGTIKWNVGAWTNRESITFSVDLNTLLTVEESALQ